MLFTGIRLNFIILSMKRIVRVLEIFDDIVYTAISGFLILISITIFSYAFVNFLIGLFQHTSVVHLTLKVLEDMLLILILLEIIWLVLNYLKSRTLTVEPFLFIGIISGVRKILIIGAHSVEEISLDKIKIYEFETIISLIVVVALVVSLYLIRKSRSLYLQKRD